MKDEDIAKKCLNNSINSIYGSAAIPIQKSMDDFLKNAFKIIYPKPNDMSDKDYEEFIDELIKTKNDINDHIKQYEQRKSILINMINDLSKKRMMYDHKFNRDWFKSDKEFEDFHNHLNDMIKDIDSLISDCNLLINDIDDQIKELKLVDIRI